MIALLSYDGGFYWLHTDHLGSGRKITNTSGTVVYRGEFDPHGQALYEWHSSGQTYLNSHKYTGYERDWATNLNYAKARTYHHNRGRFMQPDPLGLGAADVTNPQSLNRYSYVQNDPVNFTDPLGLFRICFWRIEERSGWDGDTYYVNRPVLVFDGCIDFDGGVYEPVGGSGGGGGGQQSGQNTQSDQENKPPCGEPPWDQAIGENGIYNQLLNPIGVKHNWIQNQHVYTITKPGSFSDFEDRLKANGWENFSTDPHYEHWGYNDYRKQHNGEWYHLSMGRPLTKFHGKEGPRVDRSAPPTGFTLHWEEAKPGSVRPNYRTKV